MNKIIRKIQIPAIFVAIFLIMPLVTFAEAPTPSEAPSITDQGNGGVVSGSGSAPSTTDQGNGGVVSGYGSAPSTTDQGNGGVVSGSGSAPSVSDQGNGGVVSGSGSAPSVSDQGNGGVVNTNTQNPNTDNKSPASTGGSSRSGGRSDSRNIVIAINPSTCLYLNDYLSIDSKNSEMEVIKLQAFLLNTERLNVDINGKFDQKTFNAVKAFQKKYANDVLSPWGSNVPTGKVFYTTKKKINEIQCNSPFPLTLKQLNEIELYKNRKTVTSVVVTAPEITITPEISTTTVDSTINVEDIDSTQPGVVIKAPVTTRVYNFIKWLFAF